jgi:hypothetical protein
MRIARARSGYHAPDESERRWDVAQPIPTESQELPVCQQIFSPFPPVIKMSERVTQFFSLGSRSPNVQRESGEFDFAG